MQNDNAERVVLRILFGKRYIYKDRITRRAIRYFCEYEGIEKQCPFGKEHPGLCGQKCRYRKHYDECTNIKKFMSDAETLKMGVLQEMKKYEELKKISAMPCIEVALIFDSATSRYLCGINLLCNGTDVDIGKEWYDCQAWTGCKFPYNRNSSPCPFYEEHVLLEDICKNRRLCVVGLKGVYDCLDEATRIYRVLPDEEYLDEYILEPDFLDDSPEDYDRVMKKRAAAGF